MPPMQPVESSSVDAVGFDPARNELTIRFVGGGTYVYGMVPRAVFEALLAAESIGTFVNQRVKPRFPVRTVAAAS
ncbi:KTSC domain-containing protein [Agrococcus baldri]|uniref:KTSC domain-containing protein n=1 Tax=Agrococcus baldri TaxID=153730 RepID=A0AA94HP69_9MICO|nr:KTSC domain-containing protein [Agrococcus baldri]SFS18040.1 KTSC domain-containing protein [Agrococcus baldri]